MIHRCFFSFPCVDLRPDWQVAEKPASTVTPAEAGVQNALKKPDSLFRGNDDEGPKSAFSATG
jgi:hypothetical protein